MQAYHEAIILIPGFLGFKQIGDFYYFADRVEAALRASLAVLSPGHPIPVVPVTVLPTEGLADRQMQLVSALQHIDASLGGVDHIHLIGHSTGGVDARFLTAEEPLNAGKTWQKLDPSGIRKKIKTVISLGSPHHGTGLAHSTLARYFRHPLVNFFGFASFAEALLLLMSSLKFDRMALDAIVGAVSDAGAAGKYVFEVLNSRELADDLRPEKLARLHKNYRPGIAGVTFKSVVTMVAAHTPEYTDATGEKGLREPDPFFTYLYDQTAASEGEPSEIVSQAITRLSQAIKDPNLLVMHPEAQFREISAKLNDGIVNSARQLIDPLDKDELLAVAVADHIDVVGYYPRWVLTENNKTDLFRSPLHIGILHSGSGFSDDQFYTLFKRIAEAIV